MTREPTSENDADHDAFEHVADLFKALGHPMRVRVLWELSERGATSAGVLGEVIDMEQSALSHQLQVLRRHRLVRRTRVGREVHYELLDDHVQHIVRDALVHVGESREPSKTGGGVDDVVPSAVGEQA